MVKPGLHVRRDDSGRVRQAVAALTRDRVLVGVPSTRAGRGSAGQANNADLAFWHDQGAPEANVPARPFMKPGIAAAASANDALFRKAAAAAIEGRLSAVGAIFQAIGLQTASAIKKVITSNIPPPLSPRTIANRYRQRGTASRRKSELKYAELLAKGEAPGAAQSKAGIVALINTGQLRNAISYVVRKAK